MPRGNCKQKNLKNEPGSDFSNVTTCSSDSQGEVSVYEIDILSYGNPKGKNDEVFTYKNGKKWKFKFNDSELVVENDSFKGKTEVSNNIEIPFNPMIKSHYPILEALRVEPDLQSVSFELDSEEKITTNETNHKFSIKEKTEDKKCSSLEQKRSKEKFNPQLGKLVVESFVEERDGKIKKLKKNLKKLENDSVHFHHHEHHHHYYLSSSKAQSTKNYMKIIRSSYPKKEDSKVEEKNEEHEKMDASAVNIPSTATYVCNHSPSLSHPKIDSSNLENSNDFSTGKKNSHIYLPKYSNSIDSFLGASSDLVMAHTFSQAEISKRGSNKSTTLGEVHRKSSVEPSAKDVFAKLAPKKLSKTEYNELMKSLEVLDKYMEQRTLSNANTRVSYIKCECLTEKEDEEDTIENHNSEVLLGTATVEKTFGNEAITRRTIKTSSDKNRYASFFSAKRSNESLGLKTVSHRDLTKYLKQELKDIKVRLRDLEKLYSRKRMNAKCVAIDLRGNDLNPKVIPGQEIHVFSTKTYIMKADECSRGPSACST